MWRIWQWLEQNQDEGIEPIIQVYDELLFEVPEGREDVAPVLKAMMLADAPMYRVPLKADIAIGKRWGEL